MEIIDPHKDRGKYDQENEKDRRKDQGPEDDLNNRVHNLDQADIEFSGHKHPRGFIVYQ